MTDPAITPAALPPIRDARFDFERPDRLLEKVGSRPELERLREELDRAEVFEPSDVPRDIVTMNSRIRFADEATGEESEISLVFPRHADAEQGRISILAFVGTALRGLSVGARIEWPVPE